MVSEPDSVAFTRSHLDDRQKRLAFIAAGLVLIALLVYAGIRAFGANTANLYPVQVNGKFGYINRSGKMAIQPQFDDAQEYAGGFAAVSMGKRWGYVDTQGKLVIAPQFDLADPYSDGYAMVGAGPRLGYIDKAGKYVINPQYEGAGHLAKVSRRS